MIPRLVVILLFSLVCFTTSCEQSQLTFDDVLIRGGQLLDGTGAPAQRGRRILGLRGDAIVERWRISRVPRRGK